MTYPRYLISRIALAFGYVRRNHRLSEAASEVHLLKEAETYLGMQCWEFVEAIEDLSVEYWNLRKLIKQSDEIDLKVVSFREELDKAQAERIELVNAPPQQNEAWQAAKNERQEEMERLANRREQLVQKARELRRQYTAMKTKREVLLEEHEGNPHDPDFNTQLVSIEDRISDIRQSFDRIKQEREEVGRLMEREERRNVELTRKISGIKEQQKTKASAEFQAMSDINKELSQLRAERGLLDVRMRQLYSEIGRHLSLNAFSDSQCRMAVKKQRRLVDVMRALRRSVVMNHKLANRLLED